MVRQRLSRSPSGGWSMFRPMAALLLLALLLAGCLGGEARTTLGDKLVYGGVDLKGGAPDGMFVVAKVCDSAGCASDQIPNAIRWVVAQGAKVISLSLGGPEGQSPFGLVAPSDLTNAVN